jgi:hypothetical protein
LKKAPQKLFCESRSVPLKRHVMPAKAGIHDFCANKKSWMADQVRHDGKLQRPPAPGQKFFAELFFQKSDRLL